MRFGKFIHTVQLQHNDGNCFYAPLFVLMPSADRRVKIVPYLSSGPQDGGQSDPIREQQKEPAKMRGNSTSSNPECLNQQIMGMYIKISKREHGCGMCFSDFSRETQNISCYFNHTVFQTSGAKDGWTRRRCTR